MLKPRRGYRNRMRHDSFRVVERRIARIAGRFNVDTQKIRAGLILQLEALAEMAQQRAIDTHNLSLENKQNWARLAAYLSQVINGITKTFDETEVDADLKELEEMLERLRKNKQDWTQQGTNENTEALNSESSNQKQG
jgi:hypothetical protein